MKLALRRPLAISVLTLATFIGAFTAGRATADQPAMQTALDQLRSAERSLQNATDDKGGHRQQALKFTRKAIEQTEKGVRFDRRN
jgi:hypothetical protein